MSSVLCSAELVLLTTIIVPMVVIAHPLVDFHKNNVGRRSILECDLGSYFNSELETCQPCTRCGKGSSVDYCEGTDGPGECLECDRGWYQDEDDYSDMSCKMCQHCRNRAVLRKCSRTRNTDCGDCKPGYYLHVQFGTCQPCSMVKGNMPDACRPTPVVTTPPAPIISTPTTPHQAASQTTRHQTSAPGIDTSSTVSSIMVTSEAPVGTTTSSQLAGVQLTITGGGPTSLTIVKQSKITLGHGFSVFIGIVGVLVLILTVIFTVRWICCHAVFLFNGIFPPKPNQASSSSDDSSTNDQESSLEGGTSEETLSLVIDHETSEVDKQEAVPLTESVPEMNASSSKGAMGPSMQGSAAGLPGLMVRIQEATCDGFLQEFKKYCITCETLSVRSAEGIKDFADCVNALVEQNDLTLCDVMTNVYTFSKFKKRVKLCSMIRNCIPDVCSRSEKGTPATAEDESDNVYLEGIKKTLRQRNQSDMKLVDLELVNEEFKVLLEKEVKGCGCMFEIAVDLGVPHSTAHKLRRFKSLGNVLEMTDPDLKVTKFAEILHKHLRVAAVKSIYEKLMR